MSKKMKVICFANIKGGCGKTASATAVSHIATTLYGKKGLLIDLDPQGNTTATFCSSADRDFERRFVEILNGEIYEMHNSVASLFMDRNKDIHECIRHTEYPNLDIIPSDLGLATIEDHLKADVSAPQQFRLKKHLQAVEYEYDFCIIDCSPAVNLININGLAATDELYVPIRPDGYSLSGLAYIVNLMKTVSEYNMNLKFGGCFFTAWENFNCPRYLFDLLDKYLPNALLPIKIEKSILLAENTVLDRPLYEIDHGKNISKPTRSYINLTGYILADDKKEYLDSLQNHEEHN